MSYTQVRAYDPEPLRKAVTERSRFLGRRQHRQIAEDSGVSLGTIGKFLSPNQRGTVSVDTLILLARYAGLGDAKLSTFAIPDNVQAARLESLRFHGRPMGRVEGS